MEPDSRRGSYILILRLDQGVALQVGRLGQLPFDPGYYAYAGSARGPGGVKARCAHHRRITSKPHWHIDYLRRHCRLEQIWFAYSEFNLEHEWAATLSARRDATLPHRGFGSTDCGCTSHLIMINRAPALAGFVRKLRQNGRNSAKIHCEILHNTEI